MVSNIIHISRMTTEDIITIIYYASSVNGSMKNTLADPKQIDSSIRLNDVKQVFDQYVEQKQNLHWSHSFVALGDKYKYQLDILFFFNTSWKSKKEGMLCIDIYSKYLVVVPIEWKTASDMALAFVECMHKMNGPSHIIMTGGERKKNTKVFEEFCWT